MKNNRPSQIDLATLATRIPTGTPGERVNLALAIWEAAGEALRPPPGDPFADWQSLESILAEVMPGKSLMERQRRWRDFLPHWEQLESERKWAENDAQLAAIGIARVNFPTVAPEEFAAWAEDTMKHHRDFGVRRARQIVETFLQWEPAQTKETALAKSQVMLIGRWGKKWAQDALGDSAAQTLEMLIANTAQKLKGDRRKAQERVHAVIAVGILVKMNSKLFGKPAEKNENCEFFP